MRVFRDMNIRHEGNTNSRAHLERYCELMDQMYILQKDLKLLELHREKTLQTLKPLKGKTRRQLQAGVSRVREIDLKIKEINERLKQLMVKKAEAIRLVGDDIPKN